MDLTKDYYRILGVSPSAGLTDIRRAYRVQAVRWHPDMHVGESPEMIRIAEYRFKEVNEAYSVLSDSVQRSNYDCFQAKKDSTARPHPRAQTYSQSWTYSRVRTNAYAHAMQTRAQTHAQARNQHKNTSYNTTESGGDSSWTSVLRGFAFAAAIMFYFIFPISFNSGLWDTDTRAQDIMQHVEMEKQTNLMQTANRKEVQIQAIDIPEIVLPEEYEEAFGKKLKIQFMMEDMKHINHTCYESKKTN